MANMVFIATSLDGYIARVDGSIDWLTRFTDPDGSDYGFSEFMSRVDCLLMGRLTFESVLAFPEWPYKDKPVFVLSRSLKALPEAFKGRAEIVSGPLPALVAALGARGYKNIYVDGGATIRSLLAEDLIDEITISRVPVLLGAGRPLFGPAHAELAFRHLGTEVFRDGLIKSRYSRAR